MNTDKSKRAILLCDCKAPGHIVEFECDDDPVEPVLYIWPKLNFHLPFFSRVVNAARYVFRLKTGWCDFEEIVVRDVETAEKIIAVCQDFIDAMNHRISEEERKQRLKKVVEKIKHEEQKSCRS